MAAITVTSSPRDGCARAPTDSMRSMTDWISASVASAFITIIISCFSWGLCTLYERRPAAALGPKAPMSVAVLRAPAERLAKSPGAVGEVGVAEAPRRGVKRQVSGAIGHRGRRIVAGTKPDCECGLLALASSRERLSYRNG